MSQQPPPIIQEIEIYCNRCNSRIKFDKNFRTPKGRWTPINYKDKTPHECPAKQQRRQQPQQQEDSSPLPPSSPPPRITEEPKSLVTERQQIATLAEVVSILERRIGTLILEVQSLKQELTK